MKKENSKNQRYVKLPNYVGIRKDQITQKYEAFKSVGGKKIYKRFDKIRDAIQWRNSTLGDSQSSQKNTFSVINDGSPSFGEAWAIYERDYLSTLEKSTQDNRFAVGKFFSGLGSVKMSTLNPQIISSYLREKKALSLVSKDERRLSFNQELKVLKAFCSWYRDSVDYKFHNPVLKTHFVLGKIRTKEPWSKKLAPEELSLFFSTLEEKPFWHDFPRVQFYLAARAQEVAGLQKKFVDLVKREITIQNVVVWNKHTKRFDYLKHLPKNGETRICFLNETLVEIFARHTRGHLFENDFVFNIEKRPLSYRQIQHHYTWALKKCGLYPKYSGTHIMRHSMATLTRLVTGSLDSAQAVTGHKDLKMVQHYASLSTELQRDAINAVEGFMRKF